MLSPNFGLDMSQYHERCVFGASLYEAHIFILREKNMEFTAEKLMSMNLHDLRKIGSKIGVRAPTGKNKQQLVNAILDVSSGRVLSYKTNVGRPSNTASNEVNSEELRETIKQVAQYKKIQKEMYEKAVDTIVEHLRSYLLTAFEK